MAGGETFAMVPRRVGDVCSKYDLLPIATAVSASVAFPILLTPVAFQDYSNGCQGKLRNGEWIGVDLSNPYTPYPPSTRTRAIPTNCGTGPAPTDGSTISIFSMAGSPTISEPGHCARH